MRPGGGKTKGASFEREVCKQLSLWISQGKQEDVFWRSSMSGGRSTVAAAKGKRLATQAGDISCIHPAGQPFANRFLIECKFYADLGFQGLLTGTGHLVDFWLTTRREANRCGKLPLLIAKQNHILPLACLERSGIELLGLAKRAVLIVPEQNLSIIPFHEFLVNAVRPT
jgi:hypothetical protein